MSFHKIIILSLALLIGSTMGLRCYQCQSVVGEGQVESCINPNESSTNIAVDCIMCFKSDYSIDGKHDITRQCISVQAQQKMQCAYVKTDSGDRQITECLCNDRDLCNNSQTKLPTILCIILAGFIGYIKL